MPHAFEKVTVSGVARKAVFPEASYSYSSGNLLTVGLRRIAPSYKLVSMVVSFYSSQLSS
jgi:hypothetical protein